MKFKSLLVLSALLLSGLIQADPISASFTYQGELKQLGVPADGSFDLHFEIFDQALDGTALTTTVLAEDVAIAEGMFTVELDFGWEPFTGDQLYLEIGVREGASDGAYTLLMPRQKVNAVPYAMHAEFVAMGSVGSAEVNPSQVQLRVDGTCAAGSSIRAISSNGTVTCETDSVNAGDITSVSAGTGLNGGGSSGSVTLNADTNYLQRRVTGTCAAGSSIRAISSTGAVTCETDSLGSNYKTTRSSALTPCNNGFIQTNKVCEVTVDCPSGYTVTGGGFGQQSTNVLGSRPDGNGWKVVVYTSTGSGNFWAVANCINAS